MNEKEEIIIAVLTKNENAKDLIFAFSKKYRITIKEKKIIRSDKLKIKYLIEFIKNDKPILEVLNNLISVL